MHQVRITLMRIPILAARQVFAASCASENSCSTIADACLASGFC